MHAHKTFKCILKQNIFILSLFIMITANIEVIIAYILLERILRHERIRRDLMCIFVVIENV